MSTLTLIFNPYTKQWRMEGYDPHLFTIYVSSWAEACVQVCNFGMNYDSITIETHDPRYFPNGLTN